MSLDEPPAILIKWCKERTGIRLKREFLKDWCNSRQTPIRHTETAYKELVADFLNKDIAVTSEPVIQSNFGELPVDTFPSGHLRQGGGVVLQIQDTIDISHSTLSLLNALNNLTPVRHTYTERNENDEVDFPRGQLRWTLSDGFKQIQAMEMEKIPNLDLKKPFGTKILIDNCQVKRGMLLLSKNNVKVLGGDVPELYGGNMIAELERRFKMKLGMIEEPATSTINSDDIPEEIHDTTFVNEEGSTLVNSSVTAETLVNEIEDYGDDDINYDDINYDDINYDDMNYDDIEEFDNMDIDENYVDNNATNIPVQREINDVFTQNNNEDDDDFMEPISYRHPAKSSPVRSTQIKLSPSRSTQAKPSPSRSTQAKSSPVVSIQSKSSPSRPTQTRSTKLDKPQIQSTTQESPTIISEIQEDKPEESVADTATVSETVFDTEEDILWVDPSVWENLREYETMTLKAGADGKAHCSFKALKKSLAEIEKGTYIGDIPDSAIVKVRCKSLGKFTMRKDLSFKLEMDVTDPSDDKAGVIKVIFNNALLQSLLGVQKEEMVEIFRQGGGMAVAKQVFRPFQMKITSSLANVEIDLTVIERGVSRDSKSLLPVVNKFEFCS